MITDFARTSMRERGHVTKQVLKSLTINTNTITEER